MIIARDEGVVGEEVFGVGLVGAGPVGQAIHLPTLARMADRFRVVHVMDVDADVAERVAARVGARHSTDADALIQDPAVDVVVIGSPNRFHAEQVIAACRAGKRAVLCEKPLAVSAEEGRAIARASAEHGVPVIVGTMHAFDPAWIAAADAWDASGRAPHTVRISAVIPPNPDSEDSATEIVGRPAPRVAGEPDLEAQALAVTGGVLGLAIHDLPLARRLLPDARPRVISARALRPWGYEVVAMVGESVLEIHGIGGASWDPEWTLDAVARDRSLHLDFSLSYVHAGSSTATLTDARGTTGWGPYADNGYVGEWEHVHDVITGRAAPVAMHAQLADLDLATDIAEQSAAIIRAGGVVPAATEAGSDAHAARTEVAA
ncbi:4-carboxy-2-hydroxymuconate-6-semialdehyde dehydrogenase [Clavibacter michiganensis]|uniref:4-carboxy-2-hydroxymuconate-6-semialdehyde dehydrogenase n=1 Tax=Clavibacter michiganensis TaxID=28447 RepID=A0A251Y9F9_9MICO|nr:4-carboxy-2-hydroxymuconate-6-semialdehyde dehydrogenase [Clavibacter michiganensis]